MLNGNSQTSIAHKHSVLTKFLRPQLGLFFVLKFARSRGISSTVYKVRIDRKVLFKQKMAVNSR